MTHGLYATAHYNREVTELLRNAATYRARFSTAVSVWGPVFAEATLIDTMMAERGARQEDLGRRWAPRIQNGGSIAQRHINHNRTPTQCISSQRQPHINHTRSTPLPNNPRSTSSDVWCMPAHEHLDAVRLRAVLMCGCWLKGPLSVAGVSPGLPAWLLISHCCCCESLCVSRPSLLPAADIVMRFGFGC